MTGSPLVMGVLNVTPDSFSDGGRFSVGDAGIARGRELVAHGADIVDVGGESTRPGATPVALEEEQRRALPVIRALSADGIQTSVDTLHAETAQLAVAAGARFINDVSGGTHDPAMLEAAAWASAEHGARFVIGHWRGVPDPGHQRSDYTDVVAEVRAALADQAEAALSAGVDRSHIVLDPGLGFDKTGEQCWRLLAHLDALTSLGYPVLIGASRKRMLAEALASPMGANRSTTPEQRDLATSVVTALAARAGAWGVRVHDVAGSVEALAVTRAWSREESGVARRDGSRHHTGLRDAAPSDAARPDAEPGAADGSADRIVLTGLEVYAHHGVFDFEREQGQRFVVDAEVSVDLRAAAAGDALERTVHYGELAEAIIAAVERDPVDLIETVAERVAEVALGFAGVRGARVTVHKPDAPIAATFSDVSVTVVRP
ncbi:dihydropteroate synthase [Leucobacter tenebrionis]|uniref:dihydropteroate synthase n=1 Tax=Leucobacter tenebrionis TaxID=2873270 RepID=UPI001CA78412|nr:dihydropteroate synthase [Leucobacter tenebrionis]QZY51431.1 dihydropteroate synthase [Leucobacter tenebrionis]